MTFEEFSELEQAARRDPRGYAGQVRRLALMGQVYLWGVVVFLFVFIFVCYFLIGISIITLFMVYMPILYAMQSISKAMQVERYVVPEERLLRRADAPELFAAVESLGGRVDSIELNASLNAAMVYIPRLGALGWPRHHLILGLPLLLMLSEQEAKAVLAHELGHMRRGHTEHAAMIYRQRMIWAQLRAREELDELSSSMLKPFWSWILPRFGMMSFVLARAQEYEADAASAQLTSPQIAASALMRLHAEAPLISAMFWRPLFEQSARRAPQEAMRQLREFIAQPRDAAMLRAALEEALQEQTGFVDTHPCLRERLDALEVSYELTLDPVKRSAAQAWFADLDGRVALLDESCKDEIKARWSRYHQRGQGQLDQLDAARERRSSERRGQDQSS